MRLILVLSLLSICFGCKHTKQPSKVESITAKDSLYAISNTYMTKLTELRQFNGVVLLMKDEKIVLRKAYNLSNDVTSSLFISEESQFDLRSVAKLFAKISILQLEEEGKLYRTDFIEKYLPNFPNGNKITIEYLMENRSGLPRELNTTKKLVDLTPEEVIAFAAKETLEFTPGSEERYSNVGFQLLYYIIGKLHGSSFADYLNDTFFKPLQMTASGSNFHPKLHLKTHYAFGHYKNDDEILCECAVPEDDMQMGNLYSTVDDLAKFVTVFHPKKHNKIIQNGSISHAGGTRGKRAYIEHNFDDNYTIIFLANYDAIPFQKLVKDLQNILKGMPINIPKAIHRNAISLPKEILQQYEGTYDFVDAGHLLLDIKLENDSLYVYQKGINNGVLYAEDETTFFGESTSEESIKFIKEKTGKYHIIMDFKGVKWKGILISKE